MKPIIDPRRGDLEDDASSPDRRSMLALAGSLLAEISLPKLLAAWVWLIILPGVLLGMAPIATSIWIDALYNKIRAPFAGLWTALLLLALIVAGLFGGRTLFRLAEKSFWSLNALAVQPGYMICREVTRHIVERWIMPGATDAKRDTARSVTAAASGAIACGLALLVLAVAWPRANFSGSLADLSSATRLLTVLLANSVVIVSGYLAAAALVWGVADATIGQPRDLDTYDPDVPGARQWRIAHLSDIHTVGERFGYRIECGRMGPQGNKQIAQILTQLESSDRERPLDAVLITGDVTDAGRSSEWAEFLEEMRPHPRLVEKLLILPGNHDTNIVDRANPARLDLPSSPNKRLRKIRVLSAMNAVQGDRVRVVDHRRNCLGPTLAETLRPHLEDLTRFADCGKPALTQVLTDLWSSVFPMVLAPREDTGLGIILLDSNADAHFSFTNALGMMTAQQARGIDAAFAEYPRACWIIALHHHLIEYPRKVKALSERIGTALINGNWFIRRLEPFADRIVLMHGHRHFDWIGQCAGVRIVSAPSPVMGAGDGGASRFYVHTFAVGPARQLAMLRPEEVRVEA